MRTLDANKNYMVIIKPDIMEPFYVEELIEVPDYIKLKKGLNDGMLEIVPFLSTFQGRHCVAFCDEEGKLKGLRFNATAHHLWERAVGKPINIDHLVGPIVIIVGSKEFLQQL
jgi:hypothetical protein